MKKLYRVNIAMRGQAAGSEIELEMEDNLPVEGFWRRRVLDSHIDNCVEPVDKAKTESLEKKSKTLRED